MDKLVNPYIWNAPLRDKRGFFGRRDTLENALQELSNPDINVLVLAGPRRIGKTSILLQLEQFLPCETFLPIYFDLQDKATQPLRYVLGKLAGKTAKRVKKQPPNQELFDDQGEFFQKCFLPDLYQGLDKGCRPIFIFDELDVVDPINKDNLQENATAKMLFPFVNELITHDLRPAFVFATGRQVGESAIDFATITKKCSWHNIWGLNTESAELLVRCAEADGTLSFSDQAVQRILNLTNGHPYLTQLLCEQIWEQAYSENPVNLPHISIQAVELAIPDALDVGQQSLSWIWNGLNHVEKIFVAAMCEIVSQENEIISDQKIIQTLKAHGPRLCLPNIESAPANLIKQWMLEMPEKRKYRFTVEFFRLWVHNQKPLQEVKNELDHVNPFAEQLFAFGMQSFRRNQLEDALEYFHRALKINPDHFRAQINQGEVLLKLGRIDEAITTLERTFLLDERGTHLSLARALMAKAKILEEDDNVEEALANCIRAISISPNDKDVQQLSNAIWIKSGNIAMEQGELERALLAYQHAGAKEWDDAIPLIRSELDKNPTLYRTRFYLSEVLLSLGRGDDAVAELNAELTVYQQANKEYKKEVMVFVQKQLEQKHNHTLARLQLGQLLCNDGKACEALAEFKQAYDEDMVKDDSLTTYILLSQAETAHVSGNWLTVFEACEKALKVGIAPRKVMDIMDETIIELKKVGLVDSPNNHDIQERLAYIHPGIRAALGVGKGEIAEISSKTNNSVCLLGVVALDANWRVLAKAWATTLKQNPNFRITILCESDNMLFSKSFTCDTDSARNRHSFQSLQFARDRVTTEFLDILSAEGISKDDARIKVEIMHLPIPISIVKVDDRIFANLWLHEVDDYFEEITELHPWYSFIKGYIEVYFSLNIGRKYACNPKDEILELFDHERIPRGIYPRSSFYDTDFSQLVVWAFVFDRQGRLLIHRRANNAKDNQGMWDKSVGGHTEVSDVDTSKAISREVIEELFSEEIKQNKAELTVLGITDEDMIYLGEWRPKQRQSHPFDEIASFSREWAFFRVKNSQHLSSPRILPNTSHLGEEKGLRVIADVFLFVASPLLTEKYLGKLKNSTFKLVDLAELKNVMVKSRRKEKISGFYENEISPQFSPDLKNIMEGELRDILEEFSQYIKTYLRKS